MALKELMGRLKEVEKAIIWRENNRDSDCNSIEAWESTLRFAGFWFRGICVVGFYDCFFLQNLDNVVRQMRDSRKKLKKNLWRGKLKGNRMGEFLFLRGKF